MQAEEIFGQVCKIIEDAPQDVNPIAYKTWICTLKPLAFKNNTLYLITPSDMHRRYIMTVSVLHQYLNTALNIVVSTPGAEVVLVLENEAASIVETERVEKSTVSRPMLNEKYTFDNFVIGPGNQFAHAAAFSVAEAPATINNPLFIYGGVGLGKTHLMHAIGNYSLNRDASIKVLYITCEKYTNEFIDALSKHQITDFRRRYRENVDILMIDDVQFLSGKESTQEEIFHNINDLFSANKQIILTSDRQPKSIATLSDRLCSRFEGGLLVDITPPDLETRTAILRKKADNEKIEISDDILLAIAERASDNVRELEGALKRVVAYTQIQGGRFSMDTALAALRDYHAEIQKYYTPQMIIEAVARYFEVLPDDLIGQRRDKPIVTPRHIAYFLCREFTGLSTTNIGEEFGGRDHATIINGVSKIRNGIKTDEKIHNYVDDIRMKLRGE